jgi:aromatic ring-opening dioxygenase catalytic subunit (LigB family)
MYPRLPSQYPAEHIWLGQALAPLRDEGVLIVGGGMTYHNVQTLMTNRDAKSRAPDAGSRGFDDWLAEVLTLETPEGRVAVVEARGMAAPWFTGLAAQGVTG